jgi:hypothetical protein
MPKLMPRHPFLTVLLLLGLIEGCAGQIKPIPYFIDVKNNLCEPYIITNQNPLTYARSHKPVSLVQCDTFTAFTPADTAEGLREYRSCQSQGNCN